MPTATDRGRRRWLGAALLGALSPWPVQSARVTERTPTAPATRHWVTAWNAADGHRIGLLRGDASGTSIADQLAVPTRAHGLQILPDGSVLAVARRPGDWLLRWQPLAPSPSRRAASIPTPETVWAGPQRQFNGHALLHPDGRHLLVTETDTAAPDDPDGLGRGRVTVRRLDRLATVVADWPTGGRDPHQLLASPDGRWLWVANGGIASRPETGRTRLESAPMDASVVAIDLATGELARRWTLDDDRLSLRHLAWHAPTATLGIALQAEHADPVHRNSAPVLALLQPLDAQARLRTVESPQPMAGYGGDVCATTDGFAVSSPRAGRLGCWQAGGDWVGGVALAEVCALAPQDGGVVAAGQRQAVDWSALSGSSGHPLALPVMPDNHWVCR
ncbi:MAG: hypothetical protein RLZZ373_2208 [Pseudomonadota bacterium]